MVYVDQTFKTNFLVGINFTFAEKLQEDLKEYLYTLHPAVLIFVPFALNPLKMNKSALKKKTSPRFSRIIQLQFIFSDHLVLTVLLFPGANCGKYTSCGLGYFYGTFRFKFLNLLIQSWNDLEKQLVTVRKE